VLAVFSLDAFAAGKPLPQGRNKSLHSEAEAHGACPCGFSEPRPLEA
jgi:hypothetical protein